MNSKKILIAAIIFFLIINTTYYWEGKMGVFAFPVFLLLFLSFLILVVILMWQIYLAINEKIASKFRLFTTGFLLFVLITTFIKPLGIIDFDKLEGEDILIADREGAANCTTVFKLKDNFTFKERSVCFGVTEIKGNYYFQNDTIFFKNVDLGRRKTEFYQFAVVAPSKFNKGKKHLDLIRYKGVNDTIGHNLWITRNELHLLKHKKANR